MFSLLQEKTYDVVTARAPHRLFWFLYPNGNYPQTKKGLRPFPSAPPPSPRIWSPPFKGGPRTGFTFPCVENPPRPTLAARCVSPLSATSNGAVIIPGTDESCRIFRRPPVIKAKDFSTPRHLLSPTNPQSLLISPNSIGSPASNFLILSKPHSAFPTPPPPPLCQATKELGATSDFDRGPSKIMTPSRRLSNPPRTKKETEEELIQNDIFDTRIRESLVSKSLGVKCLGPETRGELPLKKDPFQKK